MKAASSAANRHRAKATCEKSKGMRNESGVVSRESTSREGDAREKSKGRGMKATSGSRIDVAGIEDATAMIEE